MLQIADFIGKAVLHRLAELLIAAEKRLQAAGNRVRRVADTHKLNLITVLLRKGTVANRRSAKVITTNFSLGIPRLAKRSPNSVAVAPPRL